MALLGYDGFEGLAVADALLRGWTFSAPGVDSTATITSGGLNGNRAVFNSGIVNGYALGSCYRVITSSTEVVMGCAFRVETANSSQETDIMQFLEGGTIHVGIGWTDAGQLRVKRGNIGGTLLGSTATGVCLEGSWYYLEVRAKISDTVGEVDVYVDGELLLQLTGLDTKNGGTGVIDGLRLCASTFAGLSLRGIVSYDDVYWLDSTGAAPYNAPLGPIRVDRFVPNADASVQFTPNSGSTNYTRVNEALPDGDTTYVESGTSGHKDVFGVQDLSTISGTIFAVQSRVRARRTDAAAFSLIPSVISNAVEVDGDTHALGSSYAEYSDLYELNPDGNVPWVDATVNALQLAYRIP